MNAARKLQRARTRAQAKEKRRLERLEALWAKTPQSLNPEIRQQQRLEFDLKHRLT